MRIEFVFQSFFFNKYSTQLYNIGARLFEPSDTPNKILIWYSYLKEQVSKIILKKLIILSDIYKKSVQKSYQAKLRGLRLQTYIQVRAYRQKSPLYLPDHLSK